MTWPNNTMQPTRFALLAHGQVLGADVVLLSIGVPMRPRFAGG